jgi:hypothetical protein
MARRDRDQDKKRRRQKRLEKKQRPREAPVELLPTLGRVIQVLRTPMPASWPGASDPSLARPDQVKFELAEFALQHDPGRSKERQLADGLCKGPLGFLPDLDHWAMEEFLWHGLPADPWHPIEAFLAQAGNRFPEPAQEQLRLWKEARIGLFEVGKVRNDTVTLSEWDPVNNTLSAPLRAIALNIGGVNSYQPAGGQITLTYLAPWDPAEDLFCTMGYGTTVPSREAAFYAFYLGLRHPEISSQPLPWKLGRTAEDEYLRHWRRREWHRWLDERLQFPFWAMFGMPPDAKPALGRVTHLLPSTPEDAYQFGIYFEIPIGTGGMAAGGTLVTPLDVTSPNLMLLLEYHAYRDRVGPPPGTRGKPSFLEL